jgi:hypothetical protein
MPSPLPGDPIKFPGADPGSVILYVLFYHHHCGTCNPNSSPRFPFSLQHQSDFAPHWSAARQPSFCSLPEKLKRFKKADKDDL